LDYRAGSQQQQSSTNGKERAPTKRPPAAFLKGRIAPTIIDLNQALAMTGGIALKNLFGRRTKFGGFIGDGRRRIRGDTGF
jgi:hypothetical protein